MADNINEVAPAKTSKPEKEEKERNEKPKKEKKNKPVFQAGKFKAGIETTFVPSQEHADFTYSSKGVMEIVEHVHDCVRAKWKDCDTFIGQGEIVTVARVALAKKLAVVAKDHDGIDSADIRKISEITGEIPAPIHASVQLLGAIAHDGVVHHPEDAADQSIRELFLASIQKGELTSNEEIAIQKADVDLEESTISWDHAFEKARAETITVEQALDLTISKMPFLDLVTHIDEHEVTIQSKPDVKEFIFQPNQSIEDIVAGNNNIFEAFKWKRETFASIAYQVLQQFRPPAWVNDARVMLSTFTGNVNDNNLKTTIMIDDVMDRVSRIRSKRIAPGLARIKTKFKLVDMSTIDGKGGLGQFILVDRRRRPVCPYLPPAPDIAVGLFSNFRARWQADRTIPDRYEYLGSDDLQVARSLWVNSYVIGKT